MSTSEAEAPGTAVEAADVAELDAAQPSAADPAAGGSPTDEADSQDGTTSVSGAGLRSRVPARVSARLRRTLRPPAAFTDPGEHVHGKATDDTHPSAWQASPTPSGTSADTSLPPWFRRAILTVILFVIGAWLAVRTFLALSGFWYTLFFAFFMGLCMEPAVNRLAARGIRRGMGTFLVMGGFFLFFIAFFAIFGGLLASQLAEFVRGLPTLMDSVIDWINLKFHTDFQANQVMEQVGLGVEDLAKAATNLGLGVLGVVGQAFGLIFKVFTIALFAFYFAADGPGFRRTVASWLTPRNQRTFLTVWDISTQKAGGYVVSRGLMAVASAFFHGIAFAILDVPYWLPMALWVGMVSQFIPTIGTYLAGALPMILCLVQGSWVKALIVLATVVLYQQVENYYVQPRITKSTMEIHAAVAFGSVIVGSTLFGATGALLAIPVVATLQSVVTTYGRRYELVDELSDETDTSDAARVAEAMNLAEQ